ncbi:MAG: hypothetical protein LAO04_14540 [Acidobacteriia bacterium]|nr:hypothetical protein [Terriglobia bacterium]
MDKPLAAVLSVSSVLFGFLFTGFWWILNREIDFDPEERHFKLGTGMLLASMILLGIFGILVPLKEIAGSDRLLITLYRGIAISLVGIYGYMFTELGHYSVYQFWKYTTKSEWVCFGLTLAFVLFLVIRWWML